MKKLNENLQLLMLISKAEAIISRKFQSQGLSLIDIMVLQAVSETPSGKVRCVDLAERVGLTASGVTRLLVPLEKLGIIKRITNEHDARSSYITVSSSGKVMLKDALSILEEQSKDFIPPNKDKLVAEACQLLTVMTR